MSGLGVMATAAAPAVVASLNKMKMEMKMINGTVELRARSSVLGSEILKVKRRKRFNLSPIASISTKNEAAADAKKADELLGGEVRPARVIIEPPIPPVRGANLGGWLLVEGWMTPWLFDGMINGDLLDGNQFQFKSVKENKYLAAQNGGGGPIIAEESISLKSKDMNTFVLWRISDSIFQFRVAISTEFPGMYGVVPTCPFIGPDNQGDGGLVAVTTTPGDPEKFEIIRNPDDQNFIRIRACTTGLFIQVKPDGSVAADYSEEESSWQVTDPSVFMLEAVGQAMTGEYQLINGFGREKAEKILSEHWKHYIVEDDFVFMANNGMNAVRIPVGYWIAYDSPAYPFLPGSRDALDNAFEWGEKHGIRIIIDLHAAPGATNPKPHGGSRDGCVSWGQTGEATESVMSESVKQSVEVIRFLAQRYKDKSNLLAIEVINEPIYPTIQLDVLKEYYEVAYGAIRESCPSCYVIFSNRFLTKDQNELLDFASRGDFYQVALDIHNYQELWPTSNEGAQANIDYVINNCYQTMAQINPPNGRPLLYVGEWTGEWTVQGASSEKYKEFEIAQQQVYNNASFGWTYWSLKNNKDNNYWSMKWMIEHGYIRII